MALSFRTARRLWMGVVAMLSLACILLAIVLWVHGYTKFSNFGALIAVPCFAFVGAVWTILKKILFSPQIVCVEATWVLALLPFQIRKSGATSYGALLILWPAVLGFFASEFDGTPRFRFTLVCQVLPALVWINATLVFLYVTGIISLALLTQLSCDREIWARDIDSSPCPFPFPVLLLYTFPPAAAYFCGTVVDSREASQAAATGYCLPSCSCHTKPAEALTLDALDVERTSHTGNPRPSIPIRVPTVLERQNAIRITLGNIAR